MRSTRKSLLASGSVLLLCIALLIGATFAWFTDSVTNSGNIIKAGNLDVKFEWAKADGTADWNSAVWQDASQGTMFEYTNWEPGYSDARYIRITNTGTLALKYQIRIVPNGNVGKLADVIDVYLLGGPIHSSSDLPEPDGTLADILENGGVLKNDIILANDGQLYPEGSDGGLNQNTFTLVLKMQENAGNEYQDLSIGAGFDIQLVATQWTWEKDGFGNPNYDYDATYPTSVSLDGAENADPVENGKALQEAINNTEDGGTILLSSGEYQISALDLGDKDITIEGNSGTVLKPTTNVSSDFGSIVIASSKDASLTISGVTFEGTANNDGSRGLCISGQNNSNVTVDVKDCTFKKLTTGIYLGGTTDATISNCTFTDCAAGIGGTESITGTLTVENCIFDNAGENIGWAGQSGSTLHIVGSNNITYNDYHAGSAQSVTVDSDDYSVTVA